VGGGGVAAAAAAANTDASPSCAALRGGEGGEGGECVRGCAGGGGGARDGCKGWQLSPERLQPPQAPGVGGFHAAAVGVRRPSPRPPPKLGAMW